MFGVNLLKAVILLVKLSVQLKVLSLVRLELVALAFLVVSSAVVVVDGALLLNSSVLGDLLILPLNLGVSRTDLITCRGLGLVEATVSLHGLIFFTFFNDL